MTATAVPADLRLRAMSALVLVLIVILALALGYWGIVALCVLVGGILAFEVGTMAGAEGRIPVIIGLSSAIAVLSVGLGNLYLFGASLVALAALIAWGVSKRVVLSLTLAVWAIAGLASVIFLANYFGLIAIFGLIVLTIFTDVGAYFVGSAFGGPKLAPKISPKKTWSGAVGGFGLGLFAAWISLSESGHKSLETLNFIPSIGAQPLFQNPGNIGLTLFLCALVVLAVMVGDLMISAAKRVFEVKDSSRLIPGHGGLWDRFDGFGAGAVVLWIISGLMLG